MACVVCGIKSDNVGLVSDIVNDIFFLLTSEVEFEVHTFLAGLSDRGFVLVVAVPACTNLLNRKHSLLLRTLVFTPTIGRIMHLDIS